ncbi:MAG: glycosyltransferase [Geminicoccaceae bacterium]
MATPEASSSRVSILPSGTAIFVMVVYACTLILALLHLPPHRLDSAVSIFLVTIGLLAFWRYSWWALHVVRAIRFKKTIFPRLRHNADGIAATVQPEHVYVLITSYRVAAPTTFKVYDALVKNAIDYGQPTTIIASITDQTDVDVLGQVLAENGYPDQISIKFMFQRGDGKRSAMADVLRSIARDMPSRDSVIVFMDGDIQLEPRALERTIPFFFAERDLGALTTNNRAIVNGDDWTREWYDLRYAQRDLLMSSMALSYRLLVLTGRFSVFRADLATKPSFIEIVERDWLDHWRFGRFNFLSGDDKSTWFWLLKKGYRTLYVPDVFVSGFEELPDRDRFFQSTISLMRRWYGNMLRNNGRAIALGPRPMGLFSWWCLVDQRVSIWTSLIGPGVAIFLSIAHQWSFLVGYIFWIMTVRLVVSLVLGMYRRRFSPLWPPLLYYNQVVGALVKTYVTCRLNQQTWVRQNITAGEPSDPRQAYRQRRMSSVLHAAQATAFMTALAFYTKVLPIPAASSFGLITGNLALAGERFEAERAPVWEGRTLPIRDTMIDPPTTKLKRADPDPVRSLQLTGKLARKTSDAPARR